MARFIDKHPTNPNMPPEVLTLICKRLRKGERDEFGDRGLNVFVGPEHTF